MDIVVGRRIIKKLLRKHNYKKRKIQKRLSTGEVCSRNEQFENIAKLKKEYIKNKNPISNYSTHPSHGKNRGTLGFSLS